MMAGCCFGRMRHHFITYKLQNNDLNQDFNFPEVHLLFFFFLHDHNRAPDGKCALVTDLLYFLLHSAHDRCSLCGTISCSRTCFHRAVDVGFGFIIDPVESGFHRQSGQSAVFALVSVRGGDVHGPALVVERLLEVVSVFVPPLGDPQLHPGPLIHH